MEGKIYYGIQTGYNESFVIDAETRERLIQEDPKAAGVIKPFLAGRDIKRYTQPHSKSFLLYLPWSFVLADYPSIEAHLLPHRVELEKRPEVQQNRYPWYALRRYASAYIDEFLKPKIVIAAFSQNAPYAYDALEFYSNDKTTIIPTDDLFLLGILNSKPTDFFFKSIAATKANGYFEYKPMYLTQLPIPAATPEQQAAIAALVEQTLAAKAADPTADTAALEAAIDARVYRLYGLTHAEVLLLEPAFDLSEAAYEAAPAAISTASIRSA